MAKTTRLNHNADPQQANKPDATDARTPATNEPDPRQAALAEAFLAQQRAAMGLT